MVGVWRTQWRHSSTGNGPRPLTEKNISHTEESSTSQVEETEHSSHAETRSSRTSSKTERSKESTSETRDSFDGNQRGKAYSSSRTHASTEKRLRRKQRRPTFIVNRISAARKLSRSEFKRRLPSFVTKSASERQSSRRNAGNKFALFDFIRKHVLELLSLLTLTIVLGLIYRSSRRSVRAVPKIVVTPAEEEKRALEADAALAAQLALMELVGGPLELREGPLDAPSIALMYDIAQSFLPPCPPASPEALKKQGEGRLEPREPVSTPATAKRDLEWPYSSAHPEVEREQHLRNPLDISPRFLPGDPARPPSGEGMQ